MSLHHTPTGTNKIRAHPRKSAAQFLAEQGSIVAKRYALSVKQKKLEAFYRQKLAGLDERKK